MNREIHVRICEGVGVRFPRPTRLRALLLTLALVVGCSHDTDRANPVDPQLTPAVTVSASLDSSTGIVALTWTSYEGDTPFSRYHVVRNVVDRVAVDTLASMSNVEQTSYVDSSLSPDTAYEYRVEVENSRGFAAGSDRVRVDGFTLRAVRLATVTPDPTSGDITLTWSRFRDPGFESYDLLRRVVGTDQDERLAQLSAATDTMFSDTSARHGVSYVYRVVVHAAGRELDGGAGTGRLDLPAVGELAVESSSATASASLSWGEYQGPHFSHYEIERRTGSEGFQPVHRSGSVQVTSFNDDTGLHGGREYVYRVVVVTTRDEEITSAEASGQFHEFVGSWPLDMPDGGFVRLYRESPDQISALVSTAETVRLLSYTPQGEQTAESVLFDLPTSPAELPFRIAPQSVSTAVTGSSRLLSIGQTNRHLVLEQTTEGETIYEDSLLFSVELSENGIVAPGFSVGFGSVDPNTVAAGSGVVFDNLEVLDGDQTIVDEDFEGTSDEWIISLAPASQQNVWDQGVLAVDTAVRWVGRPELSATGMSADLWFGMHSETTLRLGVIDRVSDNVTLGLSEGGDIASFTSSEWPDPLVRSVSFQLHPWLRYRPSLQVDDRRAVATIGHPRLLSYMSVDGTAGFGAVAVWEDRAVFAAEGQRHAVGLDASQLSSEDTGTPTSELRTWVIDDDTFVGYSLPDHNQVVVGRPSFSGFSGRFTWPQESAATTTVLGTGAGQEDGELFYPLSLDRGPDGRYYVVDAGNSRIQVFDADGNYLTQWGSSDNGEGEFDFGSGTVSTDFAGSVVVDTDGFIYVADVGNRRIVKYAP